MRIGVISDTHDFLEARVLQLFKGVDHILHGGDVGLPRIVHTLEEIAPVTAVLGNTDGEIGLRDTEIVELDARKFLIHHIVNPHAPHEGIAQRIAREKPDVVIFGHTHKPFCEKLKRALSQSGLRREIAIQPSAKRRHPPDERWPTGRGVQGAVVDGVSETGRRIT